MRSSNTSKNIQNKRIFYILGVVVIVAVVIWGLFLFNKSPNIGADSLVAESSAGTSSQWLRLDIDDSNGAVTFNQINAKDSVLDISRCSFPNSVGGVNPNAIKDLAKAAAEAESKVVRANRLAYLVEISSQMKIIDERILLLNENLKDVKDVKDYYSSSLSEVVIAPIGDTPPANYIGGKPVYKCIQSDTGKPSPVLVVPYQLVGSFSPGVKYEVNPKKQVEVLDVAIDKLFADNAKAPLTPKQFGEFAKNLFDAHKKDYIFVGEKALRRIYSPVNSKGILSPQPRAGMEYGKSVRFGLSFPSDKKNPACYDMLKSMGGGKKWIGDVIGFAVDLFKDLDLTKMVGSMEANIGRPKSDLPSINIKDLCFLSIPSFQDVVIKDTAVKIKILEGMKAKLVAADVAVRKQIKEDNTK